MPTIKWSTAESSMDPEKSCGANQRTAPMCSWRNTQTASTWIIFGIFPWCFFKFLYTFHWLPLCLGPPNHKSKELWIIANLTCDQREELPSENRFPPVSGGKPQSTWQWRILMKPKRIIWQSWSLCCSSNGPALLKATTSVIIFDTCQITPTSCIGQNHLSTFGTIRSACLVTCPQKLLGKALRMNFEACGLPHKVAQLKGSELKNKQIPSIGAGRNLKKIQIRSTYRYLVF